MTRLPLPDPFEAGSWRLRPPAARDLEQLVAACRDADVARFTTVPADYGPHDAREFVLLSQRAIAEGAGAHLVTVDPDTDDVLGAVGFSVDRGDLAAEIGYWTAPWARGRGVATAATRAVAAFAFDHLGLGRLTLRAAVTNPGSQRVAERVGFRAEGMLRQAGIDGPTGDPDAPRVDMRIYGLLPGELTAGR